jgi:hypothetical protein
LKLRGHLDAVSSSGFAQGWAFDEDEPLRSRVVSIVRNGREIGVALANGFRPDLADCNYGNGWCAFRARLSISPSATRGRPLLLIDRATGELLHTAQEPDFIEDSEHPIESIAKLVEMDPTLLGSIDKLRGCESTFYAFIRRRGVEAFIRAAYVFMLARPADPDGIATYTRLIRQSQIGPMDLLLILADSDEYRSRPRMLGAPNTSAFPFHLD